MEPPLDPPSNPRMDAAWEEHMRTCENCLVLELNCHLDDCSECGHPWHGGKKCYAPVESRTALDYIYRGLNDHYPCECEEAGYLSDRRIEDLQAQCFENEMQGRKEAAAEAKYEAWRER